MRVAITGGTGFIGRHVAAKLPADTVIISRRTGVGLDDVQKLTEAFRGVDVVVHASGINREIGDQTYERVHVEGTQNMVDAAKEAGVSKIIMMSFLNARPGTTSGYHESKWKAEQIIRRSGIDYTILKSGMVYGKGDHMVDHISHALYTFPLFGTVGWSDRVTSKTIRPIPISELVTVVLAAINGELKNKTVEVVGGEELKLSLAVKRIKAVIGRKTPIVPLPLPFHKLLTHVTEATMKTPLVAKAQLFMLTEGINRGYKAEKLPEHLRPRLKFTREQIQAALPQPGPFHYEDLLMSDRKKKRGADAA
jgi:uncharacterized protein YbjT (DUF2867 family)